MNQFIGSFTNFQRGDRAFNAHPGELVPVGAIAAGGAGGDRAFNAHPGEPVSLPVGATGFPRTPQR
jgi:hypothetical protein